VTIDSACVGVGTVSGRLAGSQIEFGVVKGSETVSFTGTLSTDAMHGTYHSGPTCGDDSGTWTAHRT
jgi:hypothetical protein